VVRAQLHDDVETNLMLGRMQNDLFDIGADLAAPDDGAARLRLTEAPVLRLEQEIAALMQGLPPLASFVLPGGTGAAAAAHVARTVLRRAERRVVSLGRAETLNPHLVRYLNRASDHLFAVARRLNAAAKAELLWVPGAGR
jgi:cob(I)alamin adenosyltransferase